MSNSLTIQKFNIINNFQRGRQVLLDFQDILMKSRQCLMSKYSDYNDKIIKIITGKKILIFEEN